MSGPLAGLRVVELGGIGPAPFAAMTLADLGADVVRVDRPGATGPIPGGAGVDLFGRGKRSVAVDLKESRGRAALLDLVAVADALVEGFRPGVAERLGVGPAACLARNPRLVYGRMTGWGQDGPWARAAGHDIAYVAVTGALHAIGPAGGPPQVPLNLVGDFGGGAMYLALGVLAAVREAERTGRGQVVDAAIVDGVAHLMAGTYGLMAAGLWSDERGRNLLDGGAPFYAVYETADGGHVAVGALEPKFYAELLTRLGLDDDPAAQYDPAGWPALRERLAAALRGRTRDEWAALFAGTDACVAPVLGMREAAAHPQLAARGTYVDVDGHPHPAAAPRFSAHPVRPPRPAPEPGAHTDEVVREWTGRG